MLLNIYLKPLGIKEVPDTPIHDKESQDYFYKTRDIRGWAKDPSGNYTAGWGLSITTEELAKIGLLVLNKGGTCDSDITF